MKIKTKISWIINNSVLFILGSLFVSTLLIISGIKVYNFISDPLNQDKVIMASVNVARAEREYNYLDKVPVEVVKEEIKKQAKEFGLNEKTMLNLADCESDFKNWEKNPKSTAKGVYQFTASTFDATSSGKSRISPYDYRANIHEAMVKIANGEYSHWKDCLK